MQPELPKSQLSPAQNAYQALMLLISLQPYFQTHSHHLQSKEAYEILAKFIDAKFKEEIATVSVVQSQPAVVPAPIPTSVVDTPKPIVSAQVKNSDPVLSSVVSSTIPAAAPAAVYRR